MFNKDSENYNGKTDYDFPKSDKQGRNPVA